MPEQDFINAINSYRKDTLAKPFFVAVDDTQSYHGLCNALSLKSESEIRLSDFCRENEMEPDFDALVTKLKGATGFSFLIGLGEYLALAGHIKTNAILSRLKDTMLPKDAKAVVLLRGCRSVLEEFCKDPRLGARQVFLPQQAGMRDEFTVKIVAPDIGIDGAKWLKEALRNLEDGRDEICIKTDANPAFPDATVPVQRISRAYEALEREWPRLEGCGTTMDWNRLLKREHPSFRSFLELKRDGSESGYLTFVVNKTMRFSDFDRVKIFTLLDIPPNDPRFESFYAERKELLKDLSDADVAEYVAETKIKGVNRFHYLTDNTMLERKAIIECLDGVDTIPLNELTRRYPALADYLRDFVFQDEHLTEYFKQYKRQKVTNRIEAGFFEIVRENARTRKYNLLPTRDGVIDQLDKKNTTLYFVDAMGVEFLGFIQARCAELGLRLDVKITRANLPSLTRLNKQFYDDWAGKKFNDDRMLDKVKHHGAEGFDYQQTKLPVHLVRELEIIHDVLKQAKVELLSRNSRKAIITSDHGTSRLAVVNGQELKYEVDMKGAHSGRCCAECTVEGLDSVTPENGWLVLADYGRFKGGRKAAVEVHGGATNEEVIVPVIELTLAVADAKIEVKLVESVITANFKKTATLILFSTTALEDVSLAVKGKRYVAEILAANHWRVLLPDIKLAGDYTAEVFEGANLVGNVRFTVKSGVMKENDLL